MSIENVYNKQSLRQQLHLSGWSDAEEQLLSDAVEKSRTDGTPLRTVFATVAKATGRQPNSVRNHYYLKLKDDTAHGHGHGGAFVPFTDDEVETLMRTVLTAVAKGESVRSCTLRMGNGDNRAMLRYQNKYRAILKKDPELVKRVLRTLEAEGVYIIDPYAKRREGLAEKSETGMNDVSADRPREFDVPKSDMVRSVEYAVESLARIDELNAELLFRSLGTLAAKAANAENLAMRGRDAYGNVSEAEQASEPAAVRAEAEYYSAEERRKHILALERLYGELKALVSINYDFLNKNGVNKMSHLSEYIGELSEQVNDCEQLLSEIRDELSGTIG